MFSKVIPIRPIVPLFKIYHYAEQFFEAQMLGEWEYSLSPDYLGVVIQSNWGRLPEPKKPTPVRLKNFFSKIFRQINRLFKDMQKSLRNTKERQANF